VPPCPQPVPALPSGQPPARATPAHTSTPCPSRQPGWVHTTLVLAGGTGLSQCQSPGSVRQEMPEAVQPTAAVVEKGQEHFRRRDGAALVLQQRGTGRAAPCAGTTAGREGWDLALPGE